VARWGLEELTQSYWGRHYVGFLRTLYTPIVWSCFLTGLNVEEMGYDLQGLRDIRSAEALHPVLRPFYALRKRLPVRELGVRKLLARAGLAKPVAPSHMPRELRRRTFLEVLRARGLRVEAIEVPGYNEGTSNESFRSRWKDYALAPLREKLTMYEECLGECERRLARARELLAEEPDLLMVYLPVPDIPHHIFFKGLKEAALLHNAYWRCARWVEELKAAGPGYTCLIVSDHGFDRARKDHTRYGFWSLNTPPPFRPRKVTDFFRLIMALMGAERGA